jgi:hypothetical protein
MTTEAIVIGLAEVYLSASNLRRPAILDAVLQDIYRLPEPESRVYWLYSFAEMTIGEKQGAIISAGIQAAGQIESEKLKDFWLEKFADLEQTATAGHARDGMTGFR